MTDVTKPHTKNLSFEVGQVVYILSSRYHKVFPVMIVKEMTSKTLSGEVTSYAATIYGTSGEGGEHDLSTILDQLSGQLFNTVDEAREIMVKRAVTAIEKMLNEAQNNARSFAHRGDTPKESSE